MITEHSSSAGSFTASSEVFEAVGPQDGPVAGSTSAEAAADVGGRIHGERRVRSMQRGRGELENKVEGCPEPAPYH